MTGTTTDQWGDVTTTSTATLEASVPGQVMLMEYDAGRSLHNRFDLRLTGATFPGDASLTVAYAEPTASRSRGFVASTFGTFDTATFHDQFGPTFFFLHAGPKATGTLDLELTELDY